MIGTRVFFTFCIWLICIAGHSRSKGSLNADILKTYDTSLVLFDSVSYYNTMALKVFREDMRNGADSAIGLLRRAILIDSGYVGSYTNLAEIYKFKRDYANVIDVYKAHNTVYPDNIPITFEIALSYYCSDDMSNYWL